VTVVMRGDDHMTNTPRQILILEALNLPLPRYAHVALLLGMDGAPLSKRHGAVSLQDLRKRGYLPAAVRNHLVRLGHSPTMDGWLDAATMRDDFDLSRLGRAAAKFDEGQLRHWQREAVTHLSSTEFREWIAAELPPGLDARRIETFESAVRRNVEFPADAKFWSEVVFGKLPEPGEEALKTIRDAGESFFAAAAETFARGTGEQAVVRELSERTGRKGPALFMPLRAALTGALHGPELAPLLALIPADEVRARLERARRLAT
ncbi:MAG: glutamate--tRNA ligase family protein, partial [Steroidobacteraceae bacterium]